MLHPSAMNPLNACRCELIWDESRAATAETPSGQLLQVEEKGNWTPGRMLSMAVQSSLMFEFFRLAEEAGLEVLGYVSNAATTQEEPQMRMVVLPCILLEAESDIPRGEELLHQAFTSSRICRLLGSGLDLDARFVASKLALA